MQIYKLLTLVAQELLALPEHMSSPPVFSEVCVARSFVFCVMFCRSLFVLLSFFFWPLCCLWCTKSDYHFGIFKLFLRFLCEIIIPLTKTTKLMQLSRSWLQSIGNTVLYFLPNRSSYLIEYVHFDPKKKWILYQLIFHRHMTYIHSVTQEAFTNNCYFIWEAILHLFPTRSYSVIAYLLYTLKYANEFHIKILVTDIWRHIILLSKKR
jgi:hypothetical protein